MFGCNRVDRGAQMTLCRRALQCRWRRVPYSSDSGTPATPMQPASGDFRNDSRNTNAAVVHGNAVELLIERARPALAPEAIDGLLRLAMTARARPENSRRYRAAARAQAPAWRARWPACRHASTGRFEERCRGMQRRRQSPGFSVDDLPPGRMKVISSYQRICCSTPRRW